MILERSMGGGEGGLDDDERWREVVVKESSRMGVVVGWWLGRRWSDNGIGFEAYMTWIWVKNWENKILGDRKSVV